MLLKTERLILRRFGKSDFGALEKLLGSGAVMESSVNGPLSENQIWDWLEEPFGVYESNQGIEVLAVINKCNLELIGYCGLFHFSNIDGVSEIEIGYRFVQNSWGNGYATEAARAIRDYAFSKLNLSRLIALIEPANTRSIRVAEKVGMKYEKEVMLENYDYPDYLYSMEKPALPPN